jgi:tetratricopeptide (TPR) repeat protein
MAEPVSSTRSAAIEQLLQSRSWPELITACRQVLELAPDTAWALSDLARAYLAQGQEPAAREILEAGLRRFGRESELAGRLREWLVADGLFAKLAQLLPETAPAPESIDDAILAAVFAQRHGDLPRAAALCQGVLQRQPKHPEALNHLGRALNNLGRRNEALDCFRESTERQALNPESWHNLAHTLRAIGRLPEAVPAYRKALELRPGYRSAALNLGRTLAALDRPTEALPILRTWLEREAQDVEAMVDAGLCLQLLGYLDEGATCYRNALALDPGNGLAWLYLGTLLNEGKDSTGTGEALNHAVRLLPQDAEAWAALATWHEVENRLDAMADALRRGLAVDPAHPGLTIEVARHERRSGHADAATDRLRRLSPQNLPRRQQQAYWFELGRNLDRLDRVDEAWDAFANGNRMAKTGQALRPADAAMLPALLQRLLAWRPRDVSGWLADAKPSPIFLIGFPRSGITLLSTMLGCHDHVACLEEKPTIELCVRLLSERAGDYPQSIDGLIPADVDALREQYHQRTELYLAGNTRPVLIDMFPLRTLYAAAIARVFPGAKVVFMQRHPADVVLSNFMQEYSSNAATAHFFDIGDAARLYADTMAYWQRASQELPLDIYHLRYEQLIATPEDVLRRLLQELGLPWQDEVLSGHSQRAREVRSNTSSYHQIAEPLYDRSVDRWRRYRHRLQPVLERLAPAADRFGYEL